MQGRDGTRNAVSPEKGAPTDCQGPILASPMFVNGVLYVRSGADLFAIQQQYAGDPPRTKSE